MTDVWTSGDVTLYHGDCLEILPTLSDGSVDAVVTDPPYGIGLAEWDAVVPYNVLSHLLRLSSGAVAWFGAASKSVEQTRAFVPPPERILVWAPSFTLSHSRANGMYYRWHPIYLWGTPEKIPSLQWDVLTEPTERGRWFEHPACKPEALMRRLLGLTEGQCTVLDPFMGSGTTGVACVQTGRRFIGIELDEAYFEIAKQRIIEAQMQPRLEGM
jgi:site-specific DNA-methyltransferase (adenine-specific)